jgi:hypothetical protein
VAPAQDALLAAEATMSTSADDKQAEYSRQQQAAAAATRKIGLSPPERLSNLMGALADDVEEMTDEQLLAEAAESGVDVAALKVKLKRMVTEGGKRSLLSAEVATAKAKRTRAERRERLIAAIRAFTVDAKNEAGVPMPNGSAHETALEQLCEHPYMLTVPPDVGQLFAQALRAQADDCQELREAAEAYFGGNFRGP